MGWLFPSLQHYRRAALRGDLIAGLTVWAVLVPEALAYASIAGVSPVVGLYAAPGALILYAALGSSRELVTGPMSATAALSAATVAELSVGGSALRRDDRGARDHDRSRRAAGRSAAPRVRREFHLRARAEGFHRRPRAHDHHRPGPEAPRDQQGNGDFFQQLWHVITHLPSTSWITLLVGGLSLAVILALRRGAPAVPGSLVAVVLGIVAVRALNLDAHGVSIVGPIKSGLPSFGAPDVHLRDFGALTAGGVGVMLVGFAEGLGAAKNYASREHYEIDANRELLGLGGANIAAGLSAGMVVNGSLSKTAVNVSAGARTQLAGLIVAALTILTLLELTGLFEELPTARSRRS